MPKRTSILVEVDPVGPVQEAAIPYPVRVTLRYQLGLPPVEDHPAVAVAWTRTEVLIRWGDVTPVEVWVPKDDVRRA